MFRSAYLRLTVWYVAILMALSLAFSWWVYQETMQEVRSGFNGPVLIRLKDRFGPLTRGDFENVIEQQYASTEGRILLNLLLLNVGVFAVGSLASYALARRTMRPIETALESQNRFAADASHELRTPLATMKTEIEVALRDANLSKTDMRELLRSNLEETNRMSDLAQSLLTLARTGEAPELQPLAARAIVTEVCQRLKPFADTKKIRITQDSSDIKVMAEHKTATTIVGILLDNAIKYSPEGSTITIATSRKDGQGCIAITDTGPGIAPEDLPQVFDRFYRADSSRTKANAVGGHGLGLSIAKKLTGILRGTIVAQSTQGKGSTFTLRLPLAG